MGQMGDETQPITHLPSVCIWVWGCICPGGDTRLFHLHKCMLQATRALNVFGVVRGKFSPNVQQIPRKQAGDPKALFLLFGHM